MTIPLKNTALCFCLILILLCCFLYAVCSADSQDADAATTPVTPVGKTEGIGEKAGDNNTGEKTAVPQNPIVVQESDNALLDRIIAVQATLKTAKGALNYEVRYAEDSKRKADSYAVQVTVQVPNKYRFALQQDDQKEIFISDGLVEWHVELLDEDRFASSTDLKGAHGKFSHVANFLPLDRERLKKDFKMSARVLNVEEKKQQPHATSLMLLEPVTADQKDHMQWAHIYFNDKHHAAAIQILDANKNLYDFQVPQMDYNIEVSEDRFTYENK